MCPIGVKSFDRFEPIPECRSVLGLKLRTVAFPAEIEVERLLSVRLGWFASIASIMWYRQSFPGTCAPLAPRHGQFGGAALTRI